MISSIFCSPALFVHVVVIVWGLGEVCLYSTGMNMTMTTDTPDEKFCEPVVFIGGAIYFIGVTVITMAATCFCRCACGCPELEIHVTERRPLLSSGGVVIVIPNP